MAGRAVGSEPKRKIGLHIRHTIDDDMQAEAERQLRPKSVVYDLAAEEYLRKRRRLHLASATVTVTS